MATCLSRKSSVSSVFFTSSFCKLTHTRDKQSPAQERGDRVLSRGETMGGDFSQYRKETFDGSLIQTRNNKVSKRSHSYRRGDRLNNSPTPLYHRTRPGEGAGDVVLESIAGK